MRLLAVPVKVQLTEQRTRLDKQNSKSKLNLEYAEIRVDSAAYEEHMKATSPLKLVFLDLQTARLRRSFLIT